MALDVTMAPGVTIVPNVTMAPDVTMAPNVQYNNNVQYIQYRNSLYGPIMVEHLQIQYTLYWLIFSLVIFILHNSVSAVPEYGQVINCSL